MSITQKSRWDDAGTTIPAGDAKYTAGQQPIAEYDNKHNKDVVDDIAAILPVLENTSTGHNHDGTNSKKLTVSATDKILGRSSAGAGAVEEIACTAAGRALLDDSDNAAQRVTLGLLDATSPTTQAFGDSAVVGTATTAAHRDHKHAMMAAPTRASIGSNDANGRMPTAQLPTQILNSYWHASWDESAVVQGSWVRASDANQTDYDDALTGSAGHITNSSSNANNDEIDFGAVTLNAGTYKVLISTMKFNTPPSGILEVLFGATSLGTYDSYASALYNQVLAFTYSPSTRVTGSLKVKVSGHNGASSGYAIRFSRLEIIRTG
jgi:hypothetical protein